MAKARKKASTPGAQAPGFDAPAPAVRRYRFARAHTHAGVEYVAGDSIDLSDAKADLIRAFGGEDVILSDGE